MNNHHERTDTPLASFILTYYNLPVQMLCECIDSILALSLQPHEREIIVVDDGSDVSPMNGLMHYGNDIVYMRQKNGGVSVARNLGLEVAHGEYIQFVDGDDYLLQAPYEHCLDIIRQGDNIDMVMFDFTSSTCSQNVFTDQSLISGTNLMLRQNIRGAAWAYLFKRLTLSKLRFTPGIANGEDEEFTAQLLLRTENVCETNAKAYFYRQHRQSVVHQTDDVSKQKRLEDTFSVIKNLQLRADRLPQNDKLALQRRVAQLTMAYIYNTIVLTRSRQELDRRLKELYDEGLFPLPDQNYSQKYTWFRRMTNTSIGRTILLHSLPYMKRER